jgi:peroxiredoxin
MKTMILRTILLSVFGIAFIISGMTLQSNPDVGEQVPDFSLANVDGKMVSLHSYENAKGYIVVFTCNTCPFAKAYQERLADLHRKYAAKGFPVIAVNTSDSEQDIKDRAKEMDYPFVYLYDKTQEVTKAYGAARTPHVFVLTKNKIVAYIGAIDNNYKDAAAADEKYVEDAVDALLDDKPVKVTTTKAIGCTVKRKTI